MGYYRDFDGTRHSTDREEVIEYESSGHTVRHLADNDGA